MKPTRPELPREFVAAGKRRRIIDAIVELSAERGYEATRIADIVSRAGVARKTLYDNFAGKEEVFVAAVETGVAEALARVKAACEPTDVEWPQSLVAGLEALLGYVAERPAMACVCLVESLSATPSSAACHDRALGEFVTLLRRSAPSDTGLPETIEETLVGGIAWILHRQIRRGEAEKAMDLLPELSEFLLSPYHRVAQSGSGPGRRK